MKNNPIKAPHIQVLILIACLTSFYSSIACASQYYVSTANGSDAYSGTSAQPFQTIQKCANVAKAGDTCNIGSGTYREQVTLVNSGTASAPITFTGNPGASVTISGANLVSGWSVYSGNIYVSNTAFSTPPTQLYVDGQFYDIAHYPNSGYLMTTSNGSSSSIVDSNLNLSASQIVGATVIARPNNWTLGSNIATGYSNATISLNGNIYGSQAMPSGYGFYLQNMLWMLNAPGEWFYDASSGNIYLWAPNSDNPSNHTVEVSSRPYGIYAKGSISNITVQNLAVANANQYDVSINAVNNLTLNNLSLSGGQMGIESYGMTNSTVQNNNVQNTLSTGINLLSASNVNVLNNTVNNAGNVGIPKSSIAGLLVNGANTTNMTINGNTITNSGDAGIWYMGNNGNVKNNIVDKSCLVFDDCAGIYTYTGGNVGWTNTVQGNTVSNSIGNINGTPDTFTMAQGIYLDDLSNGYTVSNNTITNADWGIFIHTGYNNAVTGNKVYNARMYGFQLSEDNSGGYAAEIAGVVKNNIITGNIFDTAASSTVNFVFGSGTADYYSMFGSPIINFGTFNNNQYCHPNINYPVGTLNVNSHINYTLSNWQHATGQDLNSTDTNAACVPQVSLTITDAGQGSGTITSAPAGVNCTGTCSALFNTGTNVTLTATSNSGSVFTGWSGACSGTGTCSVTLNAAQNVTANFNIQYNLAVTTAGNGFGVVFGNGVQCGVNEVACSQALTNGTVVSLTATPSSDSMFSGWSGACSGTGSCSTTINNNMAVTANFTFLTNTITASAANGGAISPSGAVLVNYGASQTFTVTPIAGYTPTLTVDGQAVTMTNNTYTINNVTSAHTIAANFTLQTNTISATSTTGGTLLPVGSFPVNYGVSQTFTLTPQLGYTPSLMVDGALVTLTNNAYTINNVTVAHTVAANFTLQTNIITVTSAAQGGSLSPVGPVTVNYGASQTFTVTPKAGYTPSLMVDGNAVTLTNNAYTINNVTTAHTVVANFTLQTFTVTATSNTGGTISPAGAVTLNYGTSQIYTVTPLPGYTPQLLVDGAVVAMTNNTYILNNVTASHTVAANFTLQSNVITSSAAVGGTISPSGAVNVNYGSNQTFAITPNAGYTPSLTVDGQVVNMVNDAYTINDVTAVHTVSVSFTLQTNTITSISDFGGSISPVGPVVVNYGSSQTFTVAPNVGYTPGLTVDGQAVTLTNNAYTLNNVTAAHTVEANFTLQTNTITSTAALGGTISPIGAVVVNYGSSQIFTVTPNAGYTPSLMVDGNTVTLTNNAYTLNNVTSAHTVTANFILQTNTITSTAASGGTISPVGAVVVNYGASQTFTVTPNAGYTPSLTVDGAVVIMTNNAYTFNNVTSAHTVAANFTLQTNTITSSATSGGTISPVGAVVVNYGSSQTFTVTSNAGYTPSLMVDGQAVSLSNNSYTFSNITAAHTIAANFTLQTNTIASIADFGGTISPVGAVVVNYGSSQTFTVTPNAGYIAGLTVDGQAVALSNNAYTLSNVTSAHTVEANFALQTNTIISGATIGGGITPVGAVVVNYGSSQTFTVTPNAGYTPILTVDGNVVALTNNAYTINNVTTAHVVAANFTAITYNLNASTTGSGSGAVYGAGMDCGASQTKCSLILPAGTVIGNLTAVSATGSVFSGWSGACSGTGACSVTMNSNQSVTANFTALPDPTLTASTSGSGSGSVYGAGMNCGASGTKCSLVLPAGTVIGNLTAVAATGSVFSGWSGACSGTGSCSVTMNSNQSVTANFTALPNPTLTASTTGSGSGAIYGAGMSCGAGGTKCSLVLPAGTVIGNLTAVAATGSVFSGWSGACSGTGSCSVTMNSNQSVTADFTVK